MNKQHTCQNCKYFVQHYAKSDSGFYPIFNWHCLKFDLDKTVTGNPAKQYVCPFWEAQSLDKAERDENMQQFLQIIAQCLLEMDDDTNGEKN